MPGAEYVSGAVGSSPSRRAWCEAKAGSRCARGASARPRLSSEREEPPPPRPGLLWSRDITAIRPPQKAQGREGNRHRGHRDPNGTMGSGTAWPEEESRGEAESQHPFTSVRASWILYRALKSEAVQKENSCPN